MAAASVTLHLERVNASRRIRRGACRSIEGCHGLARPPERVGFRGATRLCRGAPSAWGLEERPGCAGALRTLGGLEERPGCAGALRTLGGLEERPGCAGALRTLGV